MLLVIAAAAKNTQIQKLKEKVSETNRLAAQRHSALKEKEKSLKILDLIPRAQLETWIRQRAM